MFSLNWNSKIIKALLTFLEYFETICCYNHLGFFLCKSNNRISIDVIVLGRLLTIKFHRNGTVFYDFMKKKILLVEVKSRRKQKNLSDHNAY